MLSCDPKVVVCRERSLQFCKKQIIFWCLHDLRHLINQYTDYSVWSKRAGGSE